MDEMLDEPVHVEEMRLPDVEQVLVTERKSYATPWSRRAFVSELTENAYAHYLVAKAGQRVVGYCGMWFIVDEGHITNVAVHPDFRGRGVGRMLMQAAMDLARLSGGIRVTLEVRISNTIAQSLYESLGFHRVGVRRGYYTDNGEDAYIMVWGRMPGEGAE
ncbi:MAG: ribosomal protein S18-alanine N-acetyltransferase [Thermaerobacter sp.]|nr:ribosomal protein S18-alanine N-acetyltransferase [Thermaerobacter sp.]